MKPATIYDVARLAGVSHQTVSRLLSGFEGIRPETRARVESALAELDYRPNVTARLLRSRRSNRIGVIADRVDQTGPARIIAGAMERARERGYLLDVVLTKGLEIDRIEDAIALVNDHGVAGIIATAQTDAMVEYLQEHVDGAPLVVDARFTAFPANASMNEYSGALAADHLLALGHRRVGYVSGPRAWLAATGRMVGFTGRIAQAGGEVVWAGEGDWGADSGAAIWRGLTAAERTVTAVALGNDSMAMGLISAASADGVRVPDDLSVVGNDDIHEARYLTPPLTTVAVEFEAEGRMLVDRLLLAIEPDGPAAETAALPRLVARGSTRRLG
ncbi:LacI family DNA-binding transcriptional regulator [Amnibacterium kyonggiense]